MQQTTINNFASLLNKINEAITSCTQDFSKLLAYINTPIKSDNEVIERAEIMDSLMDMASSNDDIAMIFANLIAGHIEHYEKNNLEMPKLIIEKYKNNGIVELLNSWKPLKEDFPDVDKGLLLLDAYQKGDLSLGQLSKEQKVSKKKC